MNRQTLSSRFGKIYTFFDRAKCTARTEFRIGFHSIATVATLAIGSSLLICSSASANGYQKLADLGGTNGRYPSDTLTLGDDGLLYGATERLGADNLGTIFSVNPTSRTLTKLADFNDIFAGDSPIRGGGLTKGNNGLFYGGTTTLGNTSSAGVAGKIYSFNPTGNVLTKLATVPNSSNFYPVGLTLNSNGLFYGVDNVGGTSGFGNIFSFNPTGNVLTKLADFDGTNGATPYAGLTLGSDGLYYGTTSHGGTINNGTIYSFNPTGNVLTKLADFNETNATNLSASLTLGSNGLFYGTVPFGDLSASGKIFSFNPNGNILTILATFPGLGRSEQPYGGLTLGSDGLYYGTSGGGRFGGGTIYSFNPTTNVLRTNLHSFNGNSIDGVFPYGKLTLGGDGVLYGTTQFGGVNGDGTIFSFDPAGTTVTNPLLPTSSSSSGYSYSNVSTGASDVSTGTADYTYVDPDVAIGYDYTVTGGPNFASILIPNPLPGGDGNFTLELPGFGNYSLLAGTPFNLLGVKADGFSSFRISGIDLNEALNPANPTAFVTGLQFTGTGVVTITQNPIVENTSPTQTPENSSLLGLIFVGSGALVFRKKG